MSDSDKKKISKRGRWVGSVCRDSGCTFAYSGQLRLQDQHLSTGPREVREKNHA